MVSTLFRPVEQLLAKTVAKLHEHGESSRQALRVAAGIQGAIGLLPSAVWRLALRGIEATLAAADDVL